MNVATMPPLSNENNRAPTSMNQGIKISCIHNQIARIKNSADLPEQESAPDLRC
jgi:hypothetical protein